jgi:hypothetical protein
MAWRGYDNYLEDASTSNKRNVESGDHHLHNENTTAKRGKITTTADETTRD